MQSATYVRLFADADGVSHFEDVQISLPAIEFAPPAPPLNVAALFPSVSCGFLGAAPDWGGQVPHPSPSRQFFCTMQGDYEVTASDGTRRRFPPGSLLLLEDTSGEGHTTRIIADALVFTVALPG